MKNIHAVGLGLLSLIVAGGACNPRGTDETQTFRGAIPIDRTRIERASFDDLKVEVLSACVRCHRAEFDTEAGLRKVLVPGNPDVSEIYLRVTRQHAKPMPPANAPERPVGAGGQELLRHYILNLARTPPPATPVPVPGPGAPTYSSIRSRVIEENCLLCHDAGATEPDLSTYDGLRVHAEHVYDAVTEDDADKRMPMGGDPLSPALIAELRAWIDAGFPNPDNAP